MAAHTWGVGRGAGVCESWTCLQSSLTLYREELVCLGFFPLDILTNNTPVPLSLRMSGDGKLKITVKTLQNKRYRTARHDLFVEEGETVCSVGG